MIRRFWFWFWGKSERPAPVHRTPEEAVVKTLTALRALLNDIELRMVKVERLQAELSADYVRLNNKLAGREARRKRRELEDEAEQEEVASPEERAQFELGIRNGQGRSASPQDASEDDVSERAYRAVEELVAANNPI